MTAVDSDERHRVDPRPPRSRSVYPHPTYNPKDIEPVRFLREPGNTLVTYMESAAASVASGDCLQEISKRLQDGCVLLSLTCPMSACHTPLLKDAQGEVRISNINCNNAEVSIGTCLSTVVNT